VASAELSVEKI